MPTATVPPINGLAIVGGHASGDALICFDKPAFCSYGLKQGANAPVSEEAFAAVKAALDDLLTTAPRLAGMKFVHWYDKSLPPEVDDLDSIFWGFSPEQEKTAETTESKCPPVPAAEARALADKLIESVMSGQRAFPLPHEYFILLLSGVGGRVMIRRYQRGRYEDLQKNIALWQQDIALPNDSGTGLIKPRKLTAMLIRLLTRQKQEKDVFRRLDKELSGLSPAILNAIINGKPLTEAVAARALTYIRSNMLDSNEELNAPPLPDGVACQWLKAFLLRWERENIREEKLMQEYNSNHTCAAYHCGALLALYGAIQRAAMPEVNAGVIQRYYTSASQAPALVLGRIAQLSNHHLAKLDNINAIRYYDKHLNELYAAIGNDIPLTLSLVQQSYFALGYRQYALKLSNEFRDNKLAKEQRQAAQAAEKENKK